MRLVGFNHSEETKRKIGLANKGRKPKTTGKTYFKAGHIPWNKGMKRWISGEATGNWKGDSVGYRALHYWVESQLGRASKCSNDYSHISSRYHWANISKQYKRDVNDWKELCPKCHKQYDKNN